MVPTFVSFVFGQHCQSSSRERGRRESKKQRVSEEIEETMGRRVGLKEKMKEDEMEMEPQVIEKSLPVQSCRLLLICKREREKRLRDR